jgi:hypothetical protein
LPFSSSSSSKYPSFNNDYANRHRQHRLFSLSPLPPSLIPLLDATHPPSW